MRLKPSYIAYMQDGQSMLVSAEGSEFAGILRGNETAAFMLSLLAQEVTRDEIVGAVLERYRAPREAVVADVEDLLEVLRDIGALEGSAPREQGGEAAETPESQLASYGSFAYRTQGRSMLPLIKQGRDLVYIERLGAEGAHEDDVVLFKRGNRYTLHRVIQVLPDGYVTRGDNCASADQPIRSDQVLGVMTSVVRRSKTVSTADPAYRRYVRAVEITRPVRSVLLRGRALAGKALRKAHLR